MHSMAQFEVGETLWYADLETTDGCFLGKLVKFDEGHLTVKTEFDGLEHRCVAVVVRGRAERC